MSWYDYINPTNDKFAGGIFAAGHGNDASRDALTANAGQAQNFGNAGAANYNNATGAINQSANYLQNIANGQNSVSAEQLRQSLQQNQAAQMSMAAGASPQNQAMAARTAAIQGARLGGGLAGQQAVAGLQERQNAQSALGQLLLGQRGQDVNAATGGYGAANQGLASTINQAGDKSRWDQWSEPVMGAVTGGASFVSGGKGKG